MTKTVKTKAPSFLLARAILYAVGVASAAFGVAGWIIPELPSPGWSALVLAGLTALSAGVVPVSCEIVGRSIWSFLLIPAAVVFGGINAYSFHHGVDALIEAPRREAHHREVVQPLEVKLATAEAAVAAHVVPAFPDTMGPKNIGARMQAWKDVHAPLVTALNEAQQAITSAPAFVPFAPDVLIWSVAIAIDLSLAFGLAGIALTTGAIQKRINRETEKAAAAAERAAKKAAEIAAEQKRREKEARAKERAAREKAKAKAAAARPSTPFVPRIVAANEN
jgi:hypothetical protein